MLEALLATATTAPDSSGKRQHAGRFASGKEAAPQVLPPSGWDSWRRLTWRWTGSRAWPRLPRTAAEPDPT